MPYDPEKYREKREKVLGIKKRGLGFGAVAMIVSLVIILKSRPLTGLWWTFSWFSPVTVLSGQL